MKKFLSLLLAAMLLLSCIPAMAEDADEWKINQYTSVAAKARTARSPERTKPVSLTSLTGIRLT